MRFHFGVASVLALSSCQLAYPEPIQPPYCEEQVTQLGSVDEVGPGGVAAADFLDRVSGPRTTTLEYLPPPEDDGVYVDIAREGDSTQLDVELMPDTSELRWIDAELIYPEGSEDQTPPPCQSRLELEASVAVSTADGVFAELFETTISAGVDDDGALELLTAPIAFDPDALMGSFEVLSVEPSEPAPSFVFHELWIEYPHDGDPGVMAEPRGYVGGVAEYDLIDYLLIGVFTVATFGGYTI